MDRWGGLKLWAQVLGAWNAVYYPPYTFRMHVLERRIKLDSFLGFSVPFSVSVAPNPSLFLLGWKQFWIAGIVLSIYMKLHNSKLHIDVRRHAWKHSDWACQMWLFLMVDLEWFIPPSLLFYYWNLLQRTCVTCISGKHFPVWGHRMHYLWRSKTGPDEGSFHMELWGCLGASESGLSRQASRLRGPSANVIRRKVSTYENG